MILEELLGKTINNIEINKDNNEIYFYLFNGAVYKQYHDQDCCENVNIEDINGDLDDLIGSPLLQAEEVTQNDTNAKDSATWTFYKFATRKGYVTIRWYGESNGYYSETACIVKIKNENIKVERSNKLKRIDINTKYNF